MLIIPAIDLKDGRCVRLLRGDMAAETVYSEDPLAVGRRWVDEGARYLHVVDLDGAVSGDPVNLPTIEQLCAKLPVPIQVGGGVRSSATAAVLFEAGTARVIFGTAALRDPDVVAETGRRYPGKVALGIDARDGKVAVQGWTETSTATASDVAKRAKELGASVIIYTDINRDGTQQGINVEATRALAESIEVPVIASGGVGSLADIEALLPCEAVGVQGVIIGRALYTGAVKLAEAIRIASSRGLKAEG
jgi:phosphoribosylformimino-5-aminoimidazole carboxamide ribotide isomerase